MSSYINGSASSTSMHGISMPSAAEAPVGIYHQGTRSAHRPASQQLNPEVSVTPASPRFQATPRGQSNYPTGLPAVMFPVPNAPGIVNFPLSPAQQSNNNPCVTAGSILAQQDDSVAGFLASLPSRSDDPTRYAAWTELVQMKTRSLELQIAEARVKEREAELELARLRAGTTDSGPGMDISTNTIGDSSRVVPTPSRVDVEVPPLSMKEFNRLALSGYGAAMPKIEPESTLQQPGSSSFNSFPFVTHGLPPDTEHISNMGDLPTQTPMTPYDLEVMMQEDNLESLFSWLPSYNDPTASTSNHTNSNTIDPSMISLNPPQSLTNPSDTMHNTISPRKRQSVSPSSDNSDPEPPSKRKKTLEKKIVIDHSLSCLTCTRPIGRIMIRAPKSSIPSPTTCAVYCQACRPVEVTQRGTMIGTVDSRKRLRVSMEVDDEDGKVGEERRRVFCDVCQRVVGVGGVWGGFGGSGKRENLGGMVEVVCGGCDGKYQRCTDCGGGGGPRVGIGKWRMKQVFQPGRKTCGLSHSRLGDRPREIGVHVTPTDYTPEQLEQVVARCKGLWNEKTLSRLAVPEMLEIDLPPNLINPLKSYEDVDEIVTGNWPSREAMIRAEGADPERFRRVLGLTWAQAKPRRSARTVDLEEEYAKATEVDATGDMSTVMANIKRTNVIIPAGHELVGMWGGEWDMQHGALLISTLIPFEGADGEDSTALSVGEMITKIQYLRLELNAQRKAAAGEKVQLIPQCEHLWVVSGGTMPLVRERLADILVRKRSFVHVDEYLVRHPDFIHALQARPYGLHPDVHNGNKDAQKPLVLVRWLGKDFDSQQILKIKQQEFGGGGKARIRKRAKSKV